MNRYCKCGGRITKYWDGHYKVQMIKQLRKKYPEKHLRELKDIADTFLEKYPSFMKYYAYRCDRGCPSIYRQQVRTTKKAREEWMQL